MTFASMILGWAEREAIPDRIAWNLPCWAQRACLSSGMSVLRISKYSPGFWAAQIAAWVGLSRIRALAL